MSLIYPDKCRFCGTVVHNGEIVCQDCVKTILRVGDNVCEYCGKDKEYCNCKVGDFAFSRNVTAFYYTGAVKTVVNRYKFHKLTQLSPVLSDYMLGAICDKYRGFTFDFVTFVPSDKLKMFRRGYNPAKLLAENIANKLNLPLLDILESKISFVPQKYRRWKNRKKKMKGRFHLKNKDITATNILLVDDVMTSGATLSECALELKKTGAQNIMCVTFAITLKK